MALHAAIQLVFLEDVQQVVLIVSSLVLGG